MLSRVQTIGICALACIVSGCTSFRTTALYRFSNDSVAPEHTNRKLKGLPVKLKVPSHVRVTIHEQQLILANSPEEIETKKTAARNAAVEVKRIADSISKLNADVNNKKSERVKALREIDEAKAELAAANASTDANREQRIKSAEKWIEAAIKRHTDAQLSLNKALEELASLPQKQQDLDRAKAEAAVRADEAAISYQLISFNPAQLVVESELEYTDKIFLVDFRRPAGGVLNLSEASMDDEQYFAKVQADVTERTMADVSSAINTLKGPLTPKKIANKATPTAANSADSQQADNVHFQKSVVAIQRFDISEPHWETRMTAFVSERLAHAESQATSPMPLATTQNPNLNAPN